MNKRLTGPAQSGVFVLSTGYWWCTYVIIAPPALTLAFGKQTKQRHENANALEHNGRLHSENELLRSQNADLARELVSDRWSLIVAAQIVVFIHCCSIVQS